MTYNFRGTKLRSQKKSSLVQQMILLNLIAVLVFMGVQIIVTNQVGSKSQEIDFIRSEKSRLRRENEFLKSDILREKSLENVDEIISRYQLEKTEVIFIPENPNQNFASVR